MNNYEIIAITLFIIAVVAAFVLVIRKLIQYQYLITELIEAVDKQTKINVEQIEINRNQIKINNSISELLKQ